MSCLELCLLVHRGSMSLHVYEYSRIIPSVVAVCPTRALELARTLRLDQAGGLMLLWVLQAWEEVLAWVSARLERRDYFFPRTFVASLRVRESSRSSCCGMWRGGFGPGIWSAF